MTKKSKMNYKKISKQLEKIFFDVTTNGREIKLQAPIITDALSCVLATADGNSFRFEHEIGKLHYQQYNDEAKQILLLGLKAFMKERGMLRKSLDGWDFKDCLLDLMSALEKKD
jgi:hypothetical protein